VLFCSGMSTEKSEKSPATMLAAIGPQTKKRENGTLQETLPVRRSHICAVAVRAKVCSQHEISFGQCTDSTLSQRAEKKSRQNRCPRAIPRCSGPGLLDNLPRINQPLAPEVPSLIRCHDRLDIAGFKWNILMSLDLDDVALAGDCWIEMPTVFQIDRDKLVAQAFLFRFLK